MLAAELLNYFDNPYILEDTHLVKTQEEKKELTLQDLEKMLLVILVQMSLNFQMKFQLLLSYCFLI